MLLCHHITLSGYGDDDVKEKKRLRKACKQHGCCHMSVIVNSDSRKNILQHLFDKTTKHSNNNEVTFRNR